MGFSGLTVSAVGLGCNNFGSRCDLEATRKVVSAALDVGITLFDTADIYGNRGGSESLLGQVLKGHRDEVVIATKFGGDMGGGSDEARGSRLYIRRAIEGSLRRLQTDYVDLYQHHFADPRTPIQETLEALDELVHEGKVRYPGSSNRSAWQVVEAEWVSRDRHLTRFVSAQNLYSLLERGAESELLPACERYGIGLLPYFPLANGLLTGKYKRGEPAPSGTRLASSASELTEERFATLEAIEGWAERLGHSILEAAIAGLLARPAVASVIAGATRPEQVIANAAACQWKMTGDELASLSALMNRS